MNGTRPPGLPGPLAASRSAWKAQKAEDGRTYYYHTETKEVTWTKPAELMTEREVCIQFSLATQTNVIQRALVGTGWTEFEMNGKPYWHHAETKETTWEIPDVVTNNMNKNRGEGLPRTPAAP